MCDRGRAHRDGIDRAAAQQIDASEADLKVFLQEVEAQRQVQLVEVLAQVRLRQVADGAPGIVPREKCILQKIGREVHIELAAECLAVHRPLLADGSDICRIPFQGQLSALPQRSQHRGVQGRRPFRRAVQHLAEILRHQPVIQLRLDPDCGLQFTLQQAQPGRGVQGDVGSQAEVRVFRT